MSSHKVMLNKGVKEFNSQNFFEAHDTFEEIWQNLTGFDKTFLHGLLNYTIGLHHFSFGRWKGSVSQFEKALKKWEVMNGSYKGFEVLEMKRLMQNELMPLAKKCEENSIAASEFKKSNVLFQFPAIKNPDWLSIEPMNDEINEKLELEMRCEEEKADLWLKLAEARIEKEKLSGSISLLKSKTDILEKKLKEAVKFKNTMIYVSVSLAVFMILLIFKFIMM